MLKTRETRVEERKEEKRSEKRDRILRAAEAIFLDKGFHAASMNEIAEAANVSTLHSGRAHGRLPRYSLKQRNTPTEQFHLHEVRVRTCSAIGLWRSSRFASTEQ